MAPRFRPVAPKVEFPEVEERILAYWRERDIPNRGLSLNEGSKEWVFYEGPPTANNRPHIGHVETRVFKDIYPRFHSMRGSYVHRKAGWDCHGLPVEVEVEKSLGLNSKRDIEEFGISKFNELCRESVRQYVADWEKLTERIGFWVNTEDAYWTMASEYIESVWWSLKTLFDRGLIFQDYRSSPYCPRCETGLSDHEMGQPDVYKMVSDPSVYVRLPLRERESDLLIWTTTPWTLPSNLAAAIHPDVTYAEVKTQGRPLILAEALVEQVLGSEADVITTMPARELEGMHYLPPFDFAEDDDSAWIVVMEDFVTTSDGTGVVHIAPAFGAEDLETGKRHGLPFLNLVDRSGHMTDAAGPFAGLGVKEADPRIIEDLERRELLFRSERYEHNYPHCWRCRTPLLYYAKESWYIRTTDYKQEFLAENEATNWYPETIKSGRFGDWLRNNVDWALSRDRYWGTPLPIWRCPDDHLTCVGSIQELSQLAGKELTGLDPHRPFVDEVTFACPDCRQESKRVPDVIDAWYDSGSMPFAQWGYPHTGAEEFEKRFPADFISEAIDQTRGWFYSLLACSTLLFDQNSYRNALCLGFLVDTEGRKMSKSLGNISDPWDVIRDQGADALRWFMLTSGSPWANRRLGPDQVEELMRRYLLTLWNVYSFFVTYANIDGFDPSHRAPAGEPPRPEMDRWILAELNETVQDVTVALESYDALRAGRRLETFVDDLSNWYVRRSRRRFWRHGSDEDKLAAYRTLHECLVKVSRLTAPFTPFVAEEIFTNLVPLDNGRAEADSVHLEPWPTVDTNLADEGLMLRMRAALRVVSLGRSARNEAGIKTRQPLPRALLVAPPSEREGLLKLSETIAEELNVKSLELADSIDEYVDHSVRPNFRTLGPRLGSRVQKLAAAIQATGFNEVRRQLDQGEARFVIDGEEIALAQDDVEIRTQARPGYAAASEGPYGVALDLEITHELRLEGIAREIVRAVNDARREAGLDIADRIVLHLSAEGETSAAISAHEEWIKDEVLATELTIDPIAGSFTKTLELEGLPVTLHLKKV